MAATTMRHAGGPLVRFNSPAEVRVLDGVKAGAHVAVNVVATGADWIRNVIDTAVGNLAMHVHDLISFLVSGLTLAMVIVELMRGGREIRRYNWKRRWGRGLATIALPCLVATLYYSVHGLIT